MTESTRSTTAPLSPYSSSSSSSRLRCLCVFPSSSLRSYERYRVSRSPYPVRAHAHTRTRAKKKEKKTHPLPSTALVPACVTPWTHARPFGYISRAALIPAHIQSHPLILARSHRKKGKDETRHENRTGPPSHPRVVHVYILPSLSSPSHRIRESFLSLSLSPLHIRVQVTSPPAPEELRTIRLLLLPLLPLPIRLLGILDGITTGFSRPSTAPA